MYSNNNRRSSKLKYIDINFLVVKEIVQSGQVFIEHIDTNSMIVDPLTPKVFHEHIDRMSVILLYDISV